MKMVKDFGTKVETKLDENRQFGLGNTIDAKMQKLVAIETPEKCRYESNRPPLYKHKAKQINFKQPPENQSVTMSH